MHNASYHITLASIIAVTGGVYGATDVRCHERTGSGSSKQSGGIQASGGFEASGSFLPSGRTKPKYNKMLDRSQIGSVNCDSRDVYDNDQRSNN